MVLAVLIFILSCLLQCRVIRSDGVLDTYIVLEKNKDSNGPCYSLHAYPNTIPKLSRAIDGADIFLVHKPGANRQNYTVSLESVKFSGYFLHASIDTGVSLKQVADTEADKNEASLYNNHKVHTNRDIFRLFDHQYQFLCNGLSYPYQTFVGVDDDTETFANACSYKKRGPSKKEIDTTKQGPILSGSIQLLLPGDNIQMGLHVEMNGKARIAEPANKFKLLHPGLTGSENSFSFESITNQSYFLERREKDLYLTENKHLPAFDKAATFSMEAMIDKPGFYYIHPFENKEFSLGRIHTPPFTVRAFLNNNTAEFDKDTLWKINADGAVIDQAHFNIFGHEKLADEEPLSDNTFDPLVHDEILRMIANPTDNEISYNEAVREMARGKIDLTLLKNPSAIWHELVKGHMEKVASEKGKAIHDNVLSDDIAHETPLITQSKITELHDQHEEWSTCSVSCGGGTQHKTTPCHEEACQPTLLSQSCNLMPCTQEGTSVNTAFVQSPPIAAPPPPSPPPSQQQQQLQLQPQQICSSQCSFDCNPQICQPSCCTYNIKKHSLAPYKKWLLAPYKKRIRYKHNL